METTTVRISKETYHRLDDLRGKGETFDQTLTQLLNLRDAAKAFGLSVVGHGMADLDDEHEKGLRG